MVEVRRIGELAGFSGSTERRVLVRFGRAAGQHVDQGQPAGDRVIQVVRFSAAVDGVGSQRVVGLK